MSAEALDGAVRHGYEHIGSLGIASDLPAIGAASARLKKLARAPATANGHHPSRPPDSFPGLTGLAALVAMWLDVGRT